MQVVTSENIQQLHSTGRVDEFKAPDAKVEVKTEAKAEVKDERPRNADGTFVKAEDGAEVKTDKAADKVAVDEDAEDADLPERVRKQIGKKHRAMKEAEEFARQLYGDKTAAEKRAEAAELRLKQLESGGEKAKGDGQPDPKDFKTNAEYIDAMVDWKVEQKERNAQKQAYEAQQEKLQAEFVDRLNAERKANPDYDSIIEEAEFDVVPHVASFIAESPMGPKIGLFFAQNKDELDRIQKLPPIRALAEMGKLEVKLEKKPEAKEEKPAAVAISKAPSPITTVAGDAKTVVNKDPAKMSLQELREYDRTQRESKRR